MTALSFTSPTVRELRRLLARRSARHEAGRFVVEGPVLAAGAVAAGWACVEQFVAAGSDTVVAGAGPVRELGPGVLERVAATEHPRGPLVVVEIPVVEECPLADAGLAVVVDRVQDPGNLGTILRSAEAAGADAVVLTPGSVDPFNPKVVRASAGALFHVPVVEAALDRLVGAGVELIGTTSHPGGGRTVAAYTEADYCGRVGIVVGNEAAGLPEAWDDAHGPIRRWVTIPHVGRSESLNVAMAATLVVFEAARRRATDPSHDPR
jgi:TrmH family RNA methyltransferase